MPTVFDNLLCHAHNPLTIYSIVCLLSDMKHSLIFMCGDIGGPPLRPWISRKLTTNALDGEPKDFKGQTLIPERKK